MPDPTRPALSVDERRTTEPRLLFCGFFFWQFVRRLPKTRSGKIMRRVLRKVAEGDLGGLGDLSTLDDPAAVQEVIQGHRDLAAKRRP